MFSIQIRALALISALLVALTSAPPAQANQLHLGFSGDPATSFNAIWQTADPATPSHLEYRVLGNSTWILATGATRPSGVSGILHEVEVSSLIADTEYEYRVAIDLAGWSTVHRTRTLPPSGGGPVELIYVADTGIVGRTDGLDTGTQQILDEILAFRPHVLLLGGDYSYFFYEDRYATQDEAMDAWFMMMEPVLSTIPGLATWGNHEVFLDEDVDLWIERFAMPNPDPSGHCGWLDAGDLRLISLQASQESEAIPPARLSWLSDTIQASAQTWTLPFMHVPPFSEGSIHPSNLPVRSQLGPLAEQWGVKLWLSGHDQSYERTYPLVDVPASNSPTTTQLSGYDLADGTTWMKVSPGGKLSNNNDGFSTFSNPTPPPWTAFRDDTLHHFARFVVDDARLHAQLWGVVGDGTAPALLDSFSYYNIDGPPRLKPQPIVMQLVGEAGGNLVGDFLAIDTSDGLSDSVQLFEQDSWLQPVTQAIEVPGTTSIVADFAQLTAGEHFGSALLSSSAHGSTTVSVLAFASSPVWDLRVSDFSDRSAATSLHGGSGEGNKFIFTAPDSGVVSVSFYVDDPLRVGNPFRSESTAPYDLAGGSVGAANPLDVDTLSDGYHLITALIQLVGGGSTVAHARYLVGATPTGVRPEPLPAPRLLSMAAPRPNPASGVAAVALRLGRAAPISLSVFDLRGRRVRTLLDGAWRPAGEHMLHWDGRDGRGDRVAPGVYFYRLTSGDFQQTRKMTLVR